MKIQDGGLYATEMHISAPRLVVFLEGGEERGKELRGDETVSRTYNIRQIPNLRGFDLYCGLKEVRLNPFQQGRTWRSE